MSQQLLLAQHLSSDAVRLVRGRYSAIERDQQQDLLKLLRAAAVLQRALEMNAQLVGMTRRRHHRYHGKRLGRRRESRAAPHVAIRIGVDDVLQRLAEIAECSG